MTVETPERAINLLAEDALGRGDFVRRLCGSLVDKTKGVSSGVVLGITGPWGSGKSSILNMMDEVIRTDFPTAIIIRFDPWLISGSNDLISQFMAELTFAVNARAKSEASLKEVGSQLSKYGGMLAPGLNIIAPGLGSAIQGGFKAAEKALSGEASLASIRSKLVASLSAVKVPIVVLIDEVDRIEDSEILAVAQLVRAIVDFPRVSFALAYDVERVIDALGRKDKDRGASYLEKIVQLQVPIPIQLPAELSAMLKSEIERMALTDHSGGLLDLDSPPFIEIQDFIIGGLVTTPRDIKRLSGTFHALYGMVGHEVAWQELLGYAALLTKKPSAIELIRKEPERVVLNALDAREIRRRNSTTDERDAQWLAGLVGSDAEPGTRSLFLRLFPALDANRSGTPMANALGMRRPFLTVLRLGLVPGTMTRDDASATITQSRDGARAALEKHLQDGSIGALMDRLDGVLSEASTTSSVEFWLAVSDLLAKPNHDPLRERPVQRDLLDEFVAVISRSIIRNPTLRATFSEVVNILISEKEITLAPALAQIHFYSHGMYGFSHDNEQAWFLDSSEAFVVCTEIMNYMNERLENKSLLNSLYSMRPIEFLHRIRRSDSSFKAAFSEFAVSDDGVDTTAIMWFSSHYAPSKNYVDQFVDKDDYLRAVRARRRSWDNPQTPLARALAKAERSLA